MKNSAIIFIIVSFFSWQMYGMDWVRLNAVAKAMQKINEDARRTRQATTGSQASQTPTPSMSHAGPSRQSVSQSHSQAQQPRVSVAHQSPSVITQQQVPSPDTPHIPQASVAVVPRPAVQSQPPRLSAPASVTVPRPTAAPTAHPRASAPIRAAAVAQPRPAQAAKAVQHATKNCLICLEDKPRNNFCQLSCGHAYCRDCLHEQLAVAVRLRSSRTLHCPEPGCGRFFSETDTAVIAHDTALMNALRDVQFQEFVTQHGDQFRQCPTANCPYVYEFGGRPEMITCPSCRQHYCSDCRFAHERWMTCAQAEEERASIAVRAESDRKIASDPQAVERATRLLLQSRTKQCPRCHQGVEKNGGCDHMTCRCGYEFCWLCLGERRSYWGHVCRTDAPAAAAAPIVSGLPAPAATPVEVPAQVAYPTPGTLPVQAAFPVPAAFPASELFRDPAVIPMTALFGMGLDYHDYLGQLAIELHDTLSHIERTKLTWISRLIVEMSDGSYTDVEEFFNHLDYRGYHQLAVLFRRFTELFGVHRLTLINAVMLAGRQDLIVH